MVALNSCSASTNSVAQAGRGEHIKMEAAVCEGKHTWNLEKAVVSP